jgi:hypothetical protein
MLDGRDVPSVPSRRGRKPRAPLPQVSSALTFHVMTGPGTLGEHFAALFDDCCDNAVMESFFSTVKSELGERFEAYGIAKIDTHARSRPIVA